MSWFNVRCTDVACDLSRRIRMLNFYFKSRCRPIVVAEIRILPVGGHQSFVIPLRAGSPRATHTTWLLCDKVD